MAKPNSTPRARTAVSVDGGRPEAEILDAGAGPRPLQRRKPRNDLRIALVFLAPALVGFIVFYLVPAVRALYLSLTDWNLLSEPEFIGLDNYRRLLGDELFWNSLWVTAKYVVINISIQTVVAVLMAVLMERLTSLEIAEGVFDSEGFDISPFTVHLDDGTTFLFPITEHASDVFAILQPTMDAVFSFQADTGEAMKQANDQINALFD